MEKTLTVLLAALLLSAAALAQNEKRPDPLDPKTAVAPLVYRSAFTGYKKLAAESPPIAWRDANDAVERIGGWRVYAREAQQPAATPAAKPAAAASAPTATEMAKPMPPGHGGHKMP